MKAIITGGAGFLGTRLARAVLDRGTLTDGDGQGQPLTELVLIDVTEATGVNDKRVTRVTGDISDPALLESVIDDRTGAIFHLAAIVSGMAEADFDLGMRVNVEATRTLLQLCRAAGSRPRIVFSKEFSANPETKA